MAAKDQRIIYEENWHDDEHDFAVVVRLDTSKLSGIINRALRSPRHRTTTAKGSMIVSVVQYRKRGNTEVSP